MLHTSQKGVSLIELLIVISIVAILAKIGMASYLGYHQRAERGNGESCLTDLARKQESYYTRNNQYTADLTALGYGAASAASCPNTTQYLLTSVVVDAASCPLSRCYQLSAVPQGPQAKDGILYLTFDASQTDPASRIKKVRGTLSLGKSWD